MWETNLKIFVNIAKRKVIGQNNAQKGKKTKKKIKNHGNNVIDHPSKNNMLLQLC
jgi:hypothetical protein